MFDSCFFFYFIVPYNQSSSGKKLGTLLVILLGRRKRDVLALFKFRVAGVGLRNNGGSLKNLPLTRVGNQ
jgi:hypothetical protein